MQASPNKPNILQSLMIWVLVMVMGVPADLFALRQDPEFMPAGEPTPEQPTLEAEIVVPTDSLALQDKNIVAQDTLMTVVTADDYPYGLDGKRIFNPDPERAVWMSALFPGLGQIYNRRYWKLPIIVGGFMGLAYATSWNNNQFQDYSQAYTDLMDSDPSTNSYMNFFPPNTDESSLSESWLQNVMKSRKDYYRRNRDLCIICIVGLYLICMLDSYVDASLAHFDISDNLSMDMAPQLLINPSNSKPSLAMSWALNF